MPSYLSLLVSPVLSKTTTKTKQKMSSDLFKSISSFQAGPLCFLFLLICISSSTSSLSLYFSAGFSSLGAALWQMVVLPESCDSDLRMDLNKVTCTFLLLLRHKLIDCLYFWLISFLLFLNHKSSYILKHNNLNTGDELNISSFLKKKLFLQKKKKKKHIKTWNKNKDFAYELFFPTSFFMKLPLFLF